MLEWLYAGDYAMNLVQDANTNFQLVWLFFNTNVYIIADKYRIKGLKSQAWKNIRKRSEYDEFSNADSTKFAEVITLVWAYTLESDKLRIAILDIARAAVRKLLLCKAFRGLLRDDRNFSIDFDARMANPLDTMLGRTSGSDGDSADSMDEEFSSRNHRLRDSVSRSGRKLRRWTTS